MQLKQSSLLESSHEGDVVHGVGYEVQLTWDVPVGQHTGVLDVRVYWHDIVYQAQVDFGLCPGQDFDFEICSGQDIRYLMSVTLNMNGMVMKPTSRTIM